MLRENRLHDSDKLIDRRLRLAVAVDARARSAAREGLTMHVVAVHLAHFDLLFSSPSCGGQLLSVRKVIQIKARLKQHFLRKSRISN